MKFDELPAWSHCSKPCTAHLNAGPILGRNLVNSSNEALGIASSVVIGFNVMDCCPNYATPINDIISVHFSYQNTCSQFL